MQVGKYQFKPSVAVTLISLLVFIVLLSLGIWQLNRAEYKADTQQALQSSLELVEIEIATPLGKDTNYRFRHARLKGYFDGKHQYLLDNRVEKGRPGFLIITPFVYASGKAVILVNRGWLPLGETRQALPDISVAKKPLVIRGILADIPGKLPNFGIADIVSDGQWPRVIRDVEIEQISSELGYTMPPYLLQLSGENGSAYAQNWQPVASGPEKSKSYAIQWFGMALVILILFIGLNSRRLEE
jgi:surfeit locus 1 family protein